MSLPKLLLDQGVSHHAATLLCERGHDAVHVRDLGLAKAADHAIIDEARRQDRHIVTFDGDFHTILALSGARGPSAILLRLEHLTGPALVALLLRHQAALTGDLERGSLVTIGPGSYRCRPLPIQR